MNTMRVRISGCIAAVFSVLTMAGPVAAQEMGDFTLETLDGDTFTLSDYLGEKVMLITFFTTYCNPCKKEHPHLQRMQDEHADKGLQVIAISSDEPGNITKVRSWVHRYHLKFPILLDSDSAITRQYDPDQTFPLTLLVGFDGKIRGIYQGYTAGDEIQLEADVVKLLEEKE